MQEEEKNGQPTSDSSLTAPSDSIQAAFASLDAASSTYEAIQFSSSSHEDTFHQPFVSSSRSNLLATPIQSNASNLQNRALIGGPTNEEMHERAQRAQEVRKKKRSIDDQEKISTSKSLSSRNYAVCNPPPPWQGIPFSPNSTQIPQQDAVEISTSSSSMNVTSGEPNEPLPDSKDTPDLSSKEAANKDRKKNSLSWSARRDRKIARRRSSPPLTRRRAAVENQTTSIPPLLPESKNNRQFLSITDHSAEITDPSNESTIVEPKKNADVRAEVHTMGKSGRKSKPIAQLDMTFTDPEQVLDLNESQVVVLEDKHAAAAAGKAPHTELLDVSSETESEDDQPSHNATPVVLNESGSETEEEGEVIVIRQSKHKPQQRSRTSKGNSTEKKRKDTKNVTRPTAKKVIGTSSKGDTKLLPKRTKKGPPKGSPIFDGLVFIILGFWTKVKMYENLIEKHSGTLARKREVKDFQNQILPQFLNFEPSKNQSEDQINISQNPFVGITHIVYCPHGAYLPDQNIIQQSIREWYQKTTSENNISEMQILDPVEFLLNLNHSNLIESRWISDCISACLCKEDLLSIDPYRIPMN